MASVGAMISVAATAVFFFMLFEAFWSRRTPAVHNTYTSVSMIFPRNKYIYITKNKLAKLDSKAISPALAERVIVLDSMKAAGRSPNKTPKFYAVTLLTLIGLPTHHSSLASFQIPATPIMEGIVDLHNDIMFFLVFIITFVLYLLAVCVINFSNTTHQSNDSYGYAGDDLTHNTAIEVI